MPNINIDDAYILNETGAQVDKVTGLFTKDEDTTSGEKAFAQLNIGTAGSNRNLLDNPWFTVNQRELSSYTSGYNADRWVSTSGATVTLNASGTLTWATSSTYREFKQKIANPSYYANGTYTVSVNVVSATGVPWVVLHNGNNGEILRKSLTVGMNSVTFTTGDSGIGVFGVYNLTNANISVELKAVKLELGSVSTLANDAPPNYGEELAKCQRYFVRAKGDPFGTGYITSSGSGSRIIIPTSIPMRGQPTVSFSGTFHLRVQGGTVNVTGMSSPTPVNTAGGITLSCTGFTGASVGYCALYADGINDYIDFSADL